MADAKKPAAKKAAAPKTEPKVEETPKDEVLQEEKVEETPKDDTGTPSTGVLQEEKVPADQPVAPKAVSVETTDAAVANVVHGKEYEVTPDRGYRLKK